MSVIHRNCSSVMRKATSTLCSCGQNVSLLEAKVNQAAESIRRMHSNSIIKKWMLNKIPPVKYVNGQKVARRKDTCHRHPLNNEFMSKNAKYRWAEFRRKLILGKYAM
ncbi:hypothetical protein AWZ03_010152 [Drosophila navojoa]|uniref:Uncharacterized protein n=1 Tax=Drosophila navojoa TaxID=7232 RepID=A0A484B3Y5_DRONA|nr:hypothetical protein AWZ03_010152 [Drosophila navojoa]